MSRKPIASKNATEAATFTAGNVTWLRFIGGYWLARITLSD